VTRELSAWARRRAAAGALAAVLLCCPARAARADVSGLSFFSDLLDTFIGAAVPDVSMRFDGADEVDFGLVWQALFFFTDAYRHGVQISGAYYLGARSFGLFRGSYMLRLLPVGRFERSGRPSPVQLYLELGCFAGGGHDGRFGPRGGLNLHVGSRIGGFARVAYEYNVIARPEWRTWGAIDAQIGLEFLL